MSDADFYIDKAPDTIKKAPRKPMPLEGRWWKYGLAFAVIQVFLWLMLGFRLNPEFSLALAFNVGSLIYGTFIFFGFFPFALARLGFVRMRWFTFIGTLLGMGTYYLLSFYGPTSRINLLPFIAYLQLAFAGVSLGFLWEFGRWVFKKLRE